MPSIDEALDRLERRLRRQLPRADRHSRYSGIKKELAQVRRLKQYQTGGYGGKPRNVPVIPER